MSPHIDDFNHSAYGPLVWALHGQDTAYIASTTGGSEVCEVKLQTARVITSHHRPPASLTPSSIPSRYVFGT